MKFSLLLKITIYNSDLKRTVTSGNYDVSTFILVHHDFLIGFVGLKIDRNRRHTVDTELKVTHMVCTTCARIYYLSFTNDVHPKCTSSAHFVT